MRLNCRKNIILAHFGSLDPLKWRFFPACSHDGIVHMALFFRWKTRGTVKNIFVLEFIDIGGLDCRYLQKTRFLLCFPYISYRGMPKNTNIVNYPCSTPYQITNTLVLPEKLKELLFCLRASISSRNLFIWESRSNCKPCGAPRRPPRHRVPM